MNLAEKVRRFAYNSSVRENISILEWCDRCEGIISGLYNGYAADICLGEYGVARIYKTNTKQIYVNIYSDLDKEIPLNWFYKDWFYFCLKMREFGLPIEEGCLDFSSAVNGKKIYYAHRHVLVGG